MFFNPFFYYFEKAMFWYFLLIPIKRDFIGVLRKGIMMVSKKLIIAKLICAAVFLSLCACSNDIAKISTEEIDSSAAQQISRDTITKIDTVLKIDSIFKTDTILQLDTVITLNTILELDTIFEIDSLEIVKSIEPNKCRTDFDAPIIPAKSLFWGNSLLAGYGTFGVSASNNANDYFAHIKNYFDSNEIPFEVHKINGSYENMLSVQEKEDYFEQTVMPFINDSTNLVVIQLGDNVNEEQEFIILKESIESMLNQICGIAKNAKVLWVGEWYASIPKQQLLKEEAKKFGVTFVDISDLNNYENQARIGDIVEYPEQRQFSMKYESYKSDGDSLEITFSANNSPYTAKIKVDDFSDDTETQTISWTGKQFIVNDAGTASHPNDKAFKQIAERILEALGY